MDDVAEEAAGFRDNNGPPPPPPPPLGVPLPEEDGVPGLFEPLQIPAGVIVICRPEDPDGSDTVISERVDSHEVELLSELPNCRRSAEMNVTELPPLRVTMRVLAPISSEENVDPAESV